MKTKAVVNQKSTLECTYDFDNTFIVKINTGGASAYSSGVSGTQRTGYRSSKNLTVGISSDVAFGACDTSIIGDDDLLGLWCDYVTFDIGYSTITLCNNYLANRFKNVRLSFINPLDKTDKREFILNSGFYDGSADSANNDSPCFSLIGVSNKMNECAFTGEYTGGPDGDYATSGHDIEFKIEALEELPLPIPFSNIQPPVGTVIPRGAKTTVTLDVNPKYSDLPIDIKKYYYADVSNIVDSRKTNNKVTFDVTTYGPGSPPRLMRWMIHVTFDNQHTFSLWWYNEKQTTINTSF